MASFFGKCKVETAGAADNGIIGIQLTSLEIASGVGFNTHWFTAAESVKREQLAVALAALTTGKRVMVSQDNIGEPWRQPLESIYLLNDPV